MVILRDLCRQLALGVGGANYLSDTLQDIILSLRYYTIREQTYNNKYLISKRIFKPWKHTYIINIVNAFFYL